MIGRACLFACAVLASTLAVHAQVPSMHASSTWELTFDTRPRGAIDKMALAPNGDIVVAGFAPPNGGESDAWIARYSVGGALLWSQRVGGRLRDEVVDMAIRDDGTILIAGWRDIDSTASLGFRSNGFAAALDPSGRILWETIDPNANHETILRDIVALDDGGALVSGSRGSSIGEVDGLLVRVDTAGRVAWTYNPATRLDPAVVSVITKHETEMQASRPPAFPKGRVTVRESFSIREIDGNGAAAIERSLLPTVSALPSCFLVSIADGQPLDQPCGPLRAADGATRYALGLPRGFFRDAVVQKYGPDGLVWERVLASTAMSGLNDVAATADGGVIGAGFILEGDKVERHNWDGLLVKFDAGGNEIWRRRLGGARRDELKAVEVLPDGDIIVAGYTGSTRADRDWLPWLMRLNANGELVTTPSPS